MQILKILAAIILALVMWHGGVFLIKWLIVYLAGLDMFFSPFRKKAPAGMLQPVMKVRADGPLHMILSSVPGHKLTKKNEYKRIKSKDDETDGSFLDRFLDRLGVSYVGFFKKLYGRELHINVYERSDDPKKGGRWEIRKKDREAGPIFWQMTLGLPVIFQAKGNVRVDIIIVFTIEFWRPVTALFIVGAWEKFVNAAIAEAVREYAGNKDVEELRSELDEEGRRDLVDRIIALTADREASKPTERKLGLLSQVGIKIVTARIADFDFVEEGQEEMAKAIRGVEIARLSADASRHEKERRIRLGEGEAEAIRLIKEQGSEAVYLGAMFALSEKGVGGASTVVLGGSDKLGMVLPQPPSSTQ